jgi:hypothetical protein
LFLLSKYKEDCLREGEAQEAKKAEDLLMSKKHVLAMEFIAGLDKNIKARMRGYVSYVHHFKEFVKAGAVRFVCVRMSVAIEPVRMYRCRSPRPLQRGLHHVNVH